MEFRILGPLEVVDDDRPVPLDRRLTRALLAYLLLHANEPVSSDRIIDALWAGDPPRTAAASLQNYVSRLRKAIGPDRIRLGPAGYELSVDPERYDLTRFERMVEEARTASPAERVELLRGALALWRGPALEDLAFEEFAQGEIARLEDAHLAATEERVDAGLELGAGAELVDELESLVAQHPLRERLRRQLMTALYRADRQADALQAYQDARAMLRDELGLEPSEELRALEQRILQQDSTLLATERARREARDSRRTVTVLFCDLVDSTRLATALDPEVYQDVLSSFYDAARKAIEAHGGTVEKFIGDAVLALFGVPTLHEDDVLRAVRAALDVRAAVTTLDVAADEKLAVRIAVNSGEVIAAAGPGSRVTGAAVNVASHLEKRAGANEVVLGADAWRLAQHAVRATPLDLGDGLQAYRLDGMIDETSAVPRQLHASFVGRKQELRRLRAAFQRARKEGRCRVVTVIGEAGIGKTRLARELRASLGDEARVLFGRCVSYGAGATYLPIAEIVRRAAPETTAEAIEPLLDGDDSARVAERIAELVGAAEGPSSPGETFWAVRRLFESLARKRPLVVVLDDVHWAEPTLLDLVEYLGEWTEAPVLAVCLARPDLLDARPGWGGPTSTGFLLELESLPQEQVAALVEQLAEGPVAPDLHERILERAGGNPLFAEQLLALASDAPELPVDRAPQSLEALIGTRLDRLDARELDVLRRASMLGRRFTRAELGDLGPVAHAHLSSLERRRLVHRLGEERFRFHHVLVRDVAYRGIPKRERATLHEQVAVGLDRRDGPDELVGYHYEQAYAYRIELAPIDDEARRLALSAGQRLGDAGIRAWKRADAPAAVNLLGRAVELLPEGDATRRELMCELGLALRMRGEPRQAEECFDKAVREAKTIDDRRIALRGQVELALMHALGNRHAVTDLLAIADAAIPELETIGDDRSLGRAWLSVGLMRGTFRGEYAAQEQAAAEAAGRYRRGGWSPSTTLGVLTSALYYGPRPVDEGIAYCDRLLRDHAGDRGSEANIALWLGGLEAMHGRFDDARAHVESARTTFEDLGQMFVALVTSTLILGAIEVLAGSLEAAEQALRDSCAACKQLDEPAHLASRAAELADVLYHESLFEEAVTWVRLSQDLASDDDLDAQSSWRAVAASLAAHIGDHDRARKLIGESLEIVEQTDALNQRAKVQLDLAEVLRLSDRRAVAAAAVRRAIALYEEKGNTVATRRAQALLSASTVV
ncbi:MAG TPA: BTAD domain-containing putative transcriptional regulator [Gaiellaceae bacterium]|nr:BTAD domain-containing putative transcriptional regulator [Gaiellaceae bacterium]